MTLSTTAIILVKKDKKNKQTKNWKEKERMKIRLLWISLRTLSTQTQLETKTKIILCVQKQEKKKSSVHWSVTVCWSVTMEWLLLRLSWWYKNINGLTRIAFVQHNNVTITTWSWLFSSEKLKVMWPVAQSNLPCSGNIYICKNLARECIQMV